MTLSDADIIEKTKYHLDNNIGLGISWMEEALRAYDRELERLQSPHRAPTTVVEGLPKLTGRQAEALQIIVKHIDERGYAPSHRELAAMLGLVSSSTTHRHLTLLEQKGYIKVIGPRAIEIISRGSVAK